MKIVWVSLFLTLITLTYSQEVDIEIDYDPCTFKMCAKGETCRIVIQRESLEMAIAICVAPPDKDNTNNANNECISYSDGTNILNCKTEKEWKEVGISYCKSGGLSMHTAQVKHICHDTFVKKYLQADFTCCPSSNSKASGETPLVITSTPPAVTTELPTQNKIDDTTTSTTLSSISIEVATKGSLRKDSGSTSNASLILLFIGIGAIVLFTVVILYLSYRKRKSVIVQRAKTQQPTVIVNPYCHDYKFAFSDIADLSSYTAAPGRFN